MYAIVSLPKSMQNQKVLFYLNEILRIIFTIDKLLQANKAQFTQHKRNSILNS